MIRELEFQIGDLKSGGDKERFDRANANAEARIELKVVIEQLLNQCASDSLTLSIFLGSEAGTT